MKYTIYILLSLFVTTFYACLDDKSTIADHEVEDLHVTGLKSHYSIKSLGSLNIEPMVYSADPTDEFRYEWYLFNQKKDNELTPEKVKGYLVSEDSVLNYQVHVKSGNYRLILKVYSKKTGLMAQTSATVGVAETNGFFILKETAEGNTDLDLFDITTGNTKGVLYADRLKSLMGASLEGKPRHLDVIYDQAFLDPDSLANGREFTVIDNTFCITTEKNDIRFIRYADFLEILPRERMFYKVPDNLVPYRAIHYNGDWYVFMLAAGGVHRVMKGNTIYEDIGSFSDPMIGAAPGSTHLAYSNNSVFFYWDATSHLIASFHGAYLIPGETSSNVENYSLSDIPYEMQFVGHTSTKQVTYDVAFLQEKDRSAAYLYFLNVGEFETTLDSVAKYDRTSLMSRATEVAINSNGSINSAPYLYFVADNKFYAHSLVTDKADEDVTLEGIDPNEKIVYLSNQYWKDLNDETRNFDYIIVGTQQGDVYKVYFYNIIGGKPSGAPVYRIVGNGKMKQVHYVSSLYDSRNNIFPVLDH